MDKKQKPDREIIITDEKHGLPYSKGLMASAVMATGLAPSESYQIAKFIEDYLYEKNILALTVKKLRSVAFKILEEKAGFEFAEKYLKWQALAQLDKPLIIMIGGTTGVGKSTIATELAHRLAITRIVATDAIRQIMRAFFSKELMPSIHNSSYDAWKDLIAPLPKSVDPVTEAFSQQTNAVSVGIKAIVERSITEKVNIILEGVHILPGFIKTDYKDAFVVPLIISVQNIDLHRSHFYIREFETDGSRSYKRYRHNFESIRKIGSYIEEQAEKNKIAVIESHQVDSTVNSILNEIINRIVVPQEIDKAY